MKQWCRGIVSLGLAVLVAPGLAGEQPLTYDRVELSISARTEVENDVLVAVLYAYRQGSEAGRLADEVNQTVAWAVEAARTVPEVKVQTLGYQTNPVYTKQALTGWRVQQSVRLESRDPGPLSGLIGRLQERMAVQSIGYQVSPKQRAVAEETLITEAIAGFGRRAELVTRKLGRADYRLVSLTVDTGGAGPRPYAIRAMAMEAATAAPPVLEAGTQEIEVQVRGTIELQLN